MSTKAKSPRSKANLAHEGDKINSAHDSPGRSNTAGQIAFRSPRAALAHFSASSQINKDWIQNPQYDVPAWANSEGPRSSGADGFFSQTLNTPSAVPHMIILIKKDLQVPSSRTSLDQEHAKIAQIETVADLVVLVQLQSPGVDGWPGIAHGGFNCALLDLAMGYTVTAHRMKLDEADHGVGGGLLTAGINVRFVAPVKSADQVVLIKSSLLQRTRTKWLAKAQITTLEGRVLVEGTSIWIVSSGLRL